MKLSGTVGPINPADTALTPLNAKLSVQKANLATSGFIDPAAGIAGIADLDGTVGYRFAGEDGVLHDRLDGVAGALAMQIGW